ncbi:MAG: LuxR C-terminal-related transcriptional regulator, partial [Spirochaetaceae bacterium]|nr:LuxR C-terminal-related transcriptional regulator [Spirochaetaceae bacterium]
KTRKKKSPKDSSSTSILTEKELIVALLAAKGLYNKEIADKIFLSESRVKTCLSGIYRKLGISEKENKRNLLVQLLKG